MKISGHRPLPPITTTRPGGSAPVGGTDRPGEQVRVSHQARILQHARAPETPDPARVERLADAIRSGQFTVDVEKIADAMLREER